MALSKLKEKYAKIWDIVMDQSLLHGLDELYLHATKEQFLEFFKDYYDHADDYYNEALNPNTVKIDGQDEKNIL